MGNPSGAAPSRGRIVQLDTLRGIAVMLVFLHHGFSAYARGQDAEAGLLAMIDFGRMGIVVFFLISGFVIVRAIRDRTPAAAGLFWTHRFFRLFPAYWLAVVVAGLLSIAGIPRLSNLASTITFTDFLANLTMMPHLLGARMAIGVFWTLQIELIFYMLICLAVLAWPIGRRGYAAFAFGFFALSIIYAGALVALHRADHLSTDMIYLGLLHLSIMFCGAGLRLHWEARGGESRRFIATMPLELKLYFGAVVGFLAFYTLGKIRAGFDIHTFRAVGSYTIAFAIFLIGVERLGESRIGKFLGDRSYSFYLLHLPVLALLYAATLSSSGDPLLPLAGYVVLGFGLSVLASSIMYRFVERPSNRFGHRLRAPAPARIEGTAAAAD
ncbi:acyltransferase [Sphingomonas sp.]|uniref:acyltransferase family protein n=1 Tax=Sphingomonas sp. TaxID=28214 RepID=UPI0025FBFA57|nr:acyltransferase [Sphingomonas sp.]